MPVSTTPEIQTELTRPEEFDSYQNILVGLVNLAIAQCLSPELLERQTNLTKLYDERYAPISPTAHLELGRLGPDGPFTYIDNVEHIRGKAHIGLGATVGRSTIIKEHVRVEAGATVGDFCLLSHHAVIGEGAELSTGVGVEYGIYIPAGEYIEPGAIITEWNKDKSYKLDDNTATNDAVAVVDNGRLPSSYCPDFL